MDILEFKDLEDWRLKSECYPFEDSLGNLCITVKSKYESFGGEKDARLKEAKEYGIDRLIRFYGKIYISEPLSTSPSQVDFNDIEFTMSQTNITPITPTNLYDAASTPDYFVSTRACARMKVLVKIPKSTFDDYTVNDALCDINKPAEGYLSAFISVENYERDIDYITTSMEDFLPKMAKADKYMTNINIVKEIKRLKQVKSVIRRYFNLNSVTAAAIKEEECEPDKQSQMEIGFSYDYKAAFALIDGDKHTIGYDCFLEASLLSHPTTVNYLIQLGNMSFALTKQLSLDFDIFQFLTQHTYPTPIIEIKENSLDGIEKYDANGNLFSFANLAKLITLDLDKKSCKTDEEEKREKDVVFSDDTRRNIAETVRQSKEFVGNMTFSSEGVEDLKKTGRTVSDYSKGAVAVRVDYDKDPPIEGEYYRGQRAIDKIYNDVLTKIDFNCVLEESLKCSLEAAITRLGEAALNDPDLSEFFNADGVVEVFGLGGCGPDDGCEKELQLKVGLPVFQGITIPDDFPTIDYLAKTIDAALDKLYDILIDVIVSFIMGIFELMCKMVSELPDGIAIGNVLGEGFTSWLSDTIGVDWEDLKDGKAWADAALSAGGKGFMGVIGDFSAKMVGSWDALVQDTGVSLNLPNPNTGMVEEVFISPELIYQTMGGVKKATEDLEVVLTSGELVSLYKGAAPSDVVELAFGCLNMGNPDLFQSQEDVSDMFSALGEIIDGNFLESEDEVPITITTACQLPDVTNQDILAKNRLTKKDPLLSDTEIEELLSQEKNRLIEKIKKIHKLLKSFQDGSLFPTFPSLFGSEDSLIPETPPIIADALERAIKGLYGSTINNFNVGVLLYPPLWEDITSNEPSQISDNIKTSFTENIDNSEKIQYSIGYTLAGETRADIVEETYNNIEIGTYSYGWDFDIDSSGEDFWISKQLQEDYQEKTGIQTIGDFHYYANNKWLRPIFDFVESGDHGGQGSISDDTFTMTSDDYYDYIIPDNETIKIRVDHNADAGTFVVTHKVTTRTGVYDVMRTAGFTDNIVTAESKTDGSIKGILYTSADYTIGNNEAVLGRTISTGRLEEHKIGTIDVINLDDLQDIQFEQLEILTDSFDDSEIYKSIVEGIADSISNGKSSGAGLDALTYPTKDILGYSQITEEMSELLSKLFPLSLSDDYCDKLSPLRRVGTISGLRLFIRTAIVESAMIAIQVFDVYGTDFMDDDVFVEITKKKIKYNISRYEYSFNTLDDDLFSDMKDVALKYNEIQILIGSDIKKIDTGSQALEEMIKTEASLIKGNISTALELDWNYSSWDSFLEMKMFGLIDIRLPNEEGDYLSYEDVIEKYDFPWQDTLIYHSDHPSIERLKMLKFIKSETKEGNNFVYRYNVSSAITEMPKEEEVERIVVEDCWLWGLICSETSIAVREYGSETEESILSMRIEGEIVSFSCEQEVEPTSAEKEEIFMTLKTNLLESKEYKTLLYETFPIKEIASSLALYQESALSDDAVFYGLAEDELNGRNLFDMLSETKLSTLQTFLACLNGAGETTYIDPFLEKLKT
jgi:hypothetical protein